LVDRWPLTVQAEENSMQDKHLAFGALFGFILSRAGATSYDTVSGMFRLTDLHLFGVIGTAVAVNAVTFGVIAKLHARARNGEPIALSKKPLTKGLVAGSLLFGAGWAIAGTCPGTALAQIGEGRLAGAMTFIGMLLGSWLALRLADGKRQRGRTQTGAAAPSPDDSHSPIAAE
jgi:uncharacterized membrane protein YedE/YeeE